MRILAGIIHVVALMRPSAHSMLLVLISRAIHGLTLLLIPLNVAWLGVHVPIEEKPQALAVRNMFATAGITIGLLIGGAFTSIFSDLLTAGAASGWLLIPTRLASRRLEPVPVGACRLSGWGS